jgi:hypothetical protein
MTGQFEGEIFFPADPPPEPVTGRPGNRGIPSAQCPTCGRFAKVVDARHYYNGSFNCYSYDTNCSKCGIQTVECV